MSSLFSPVYKVIIINISIFITIIDDRNHSPKHKM